MPKQLLIFLCGMLLFSASFVHANHNDDDDNETNYGYRYSSRVRNAINDLDDDEVEDLPIPVLFGVSLDDLTPNFGDPRGGGTRTHEGLDMLAPKGTPIVSPTDAVVTRRGTGASSGKYVRTANPGGETFVYMHLDEFAEDLSEGDELEAGDVIGFVGDTGNAKGGPAHLHFEIREGGAQDPFPRLTEEFSLEEKIESLDDAMDQVSDDDDFAVFMVTYFAKDLLSARVLGLDLPPQIDKILGSATAPSVTTTGATPSGDLDVGSQGLAVTALQSFLILKATGPAAAALTTAGATGYFGMITQRALAEYQASVGISPATGYFGPITRAYFAGLAR